MREPDCKTCKKTTNKFSPATWLLGSDRLIQRAGSILLLLCVSSCTEPQLIENSKLDQDRIHDTVMRVSYASGLRVNRPLSVMLVNRTELHEILQKSAAATEQSDIRAAMRDGQSAMGFPSGKSNAPDQIVSHLSRSAAGLYLPMTRTLYLVSEPARSETGGIYLNSFGNLADEATLAHEVVHALQHQRYPDLFEPDEAVWQYQADAKIALQAAVEGDADLWAAQSLGFLARARDPEDVLAFSRDRKFEPFSEVPILLRDRVTFPYTYGYRFAYHKGKNGLKFPPASTEQVIHIGSDGGNAFLAIDLSDFGRLLETKGCRVVFEDTMGELTLSLWMRSFDSTIDQHVWEGWDGDRWIAADCENSREVAWLTSWDTEQDAYEFESIFAVIAEKLQRRGNLKPPLMAERQGREVVITSGGLRPEVGHLSQLARQARVTTRAELAAHFVRPHN